MSKKKCFHFIIFFKNARARAFTLTELLITLIIISIIGAAFISSLLYVLSSSQRTDDYTKISHGIEDAINALKRQFTNIALGMPNNSGGTGSFNISFSGEDESHSPIMAYMGDYDRDDPSWGGPVTVARSGAHVNKDSIIANTVKTPVSTESPDIYAGEELFYAWAVPTGVRLSARNDALGVVSFWNGVPAGRLSADFFSSELSSESGKNTPITLEFREEGDVERLQSFSYDGREIGILSSSDNRGASVRSWMLFPSLRVPVLIEEDGIDADEGTVIARISPYSYKPDDGITSADYNYAGDLNGFDEVHLVQAACLFVENQTLIQRVYYTVDGYMDNVLARNISGVYFVFDKGRRILTMYIVAHGNTIMEAYPSENRNYLSSRLPGFVPNNFIPTELLDRRMLVESMTWRVKN